MPEEENGIETLERGNIYFMYRPKVEEEDPQNVSDIQRMYMILSPEGEDLFRLAIIGRKRLPDPGEKGKARNWGFVDMVRNSPKSIRNALRGESYSTKTRGERHTPAARPLGEGVYRILRHSGHTHLVYALELPKQPGEAQEEVRIEEEAGYVITVKNPEVGSPVSAGLSEERKAEYPNYLQEKFRGRRFADADPPAFLDKEGTEFLLVSAEEDVEEELGLELHPQKESVNTADIFNELRLDKKSRPVKPLFEGEWD
ncbi:MAG: hypothetical protein R6U50_03670 [Desulfobacterales bacterium]